MSDAITTISLIVAVGVPSVACFIINASWARHMKKINQTWKEQCDKTNKDWGEFSSHLMDTHAKVNTAIIECWKCSVNDPNSIHESIVKMRSLAKESTEAGEALVKRITGSKGKKSP